MLNEGITNYPAICDHMARERAGHDVRERRRVARLERRRGDRHEAGRAGEDLRRPDRRRLLHVLAAVHRSLDGAPLPHAVPADRLQQSRLEGAQILRPRRPSGRLRQPRRGSGPELRSAAGLCRRRRGGGRRLCPGRQAPGGCRRRRSPKACVSCSRSSAARSSTCGSLISDPAEPARGRFWLWPTPRAKS